MASVFTPTPEEVFYRSPRGYDPRLGQMFRCASFEKCLQSPNGWVLIGHPDDEGVSRNGGRPGAALGPQRIREALYRLTPGRAFKAPLLDLGNTTKSDRDLGSHQTLLVKELSPLYENRRRVISLGGGHDYAYVDVGAFVASQPIKGKKSTWPLVLNFDAHFDLRPLESGPTSGTPFRQLLEQYDFDLFEIGVQSHSNSEALFDYAEKNKVSTWSFQAVHGRLLKMLKTIKANNRPVFLSVDMDAFSSAFAPGTSAAAPIGLDANEFLLALQWIMKSWNVKGLGIYEVAPPLDRDNQTSKLAAIFIQKCLEFGE
jgi:formiminoglutamase